MKLFILGLIIALGANAQTTVNGGRTYLGPQDMSGATDTKPVKSGTSLPGSCTVPSMFFKTDATAGRNLYFCTATNTWTQMTGSAVPGSDTQVVFNDGGAFGGDAGLTYNKSFDLLGVSGGMFVGNLGIEFVESDTNPGCSAGGFNVYADLSENKLKKCQNGVVTDLDASGGASAATDLTNCKLTYSSGTVVSMGSCGARVGEHRYAPTSTCSTSAGPTGNGTSYWYRDSADGTLYVRYSGSSSTTCTGWTAVTSTSGFPDNSIPYATITYTSGSWNNDVVDYREYPARDIVLPGTDMDCPIVSGVKTCNPKTATIPRKSEIVGNSLTYATTAGTSTAYTLTTPYTIPTANANGVCVLAKMDETSGATPTLAVNGETARAIFKHNGTSAASAVASGDLIANQIYEFCYNTSLNTSGAWVTNPGGGSGGAPAFSAITSGTNTGAAMVVGAGASHRANAADATAPNKSGTSLPGTCTVADTYVKTDEPPGWQNYTCAATNTWIRNGIPDYRIVRYEEEFFGSGDTHIGQYGWTRGGTAASGNGTSFETNHESGQYMIRNTGGANATAYMVHPATDATYGGNLRPGNLVFDFIFIAKLASTSQVKYTIGFARDTPVDAPTEFIGFRYWNSSGCTTNATDTNLTYVTASGGNTNTGTTNMPAFGSGGWAYLRMRSITPGTILFSAKMGDGGSWSSETSVSTYVSTVLMNPFFYVQACESASKDIKLDAVIGTILASGR